MRGNGAAHEPPRRSAGQGRPVRPSVLLFHNLATDMGGATMVLSWTLQALCEEFDVTLLTWVAPDTERLNRLCGTALAPSDFRLRMPGPASRMAGDLLTRIDRDPYSLQRWAILARIARRICGRYDVAMASNDEADFGRPGIQYIHYPYLGAKAVMRDTPEGPRPRIVPRQRYRPWRLISGYDPAGMARNRTLVNSDWTGAEYRRHYGGRTSTVYPPAPGPFAPLPWAERENAAICVGRIAEDKRLDRIVATVERLREHVPGFRLTIAGAEDRRFPGLLGRLEEQAARHDWIDLRVGLPRDELCRLIGRHRIGLHAKADEHFGIAVAEMVRSGCIVFAPDSGGQVEILGRDPRLLFGEDEDPSARIAAVLSDDALRTELSERLAGIAATLTPERFRRGLLAEVRAFLADRDQGAPS